MRTPLKALALAGAMLSVAWTARSNPVPGRFVDVTGGKLWVDTCGSGSKTIVLLHDGIFHSAAWDDVWPTLCKSFRVVRYDRRGYGRSPEAATAYSSVADLQEVLRATDVTHAILVGASAGGGLAIDFALAHPNEVDGLVLVGPEVTGIPYSSYFVDRVGALRKQIMGGDLPGAIKASWMFAPSDDANVNRAVKLLEANPQDLGPHNLAASPPSAASRLMDVKAPTLVLVGDDDIADNQGQAEVVEYAIPGARRVVIQDSGHMLYMEQQAKFADLVRQFAEAPRQEQALTH